MAKGDSGPPPRVHFERGLEAGEACLQRLGRDWTRLGWVRGILFLAAAALFFAGLFRACQVWQPWWIAAAAATAAFLLVAYLHERLAGRIREQAIRVRMHRDGLARLDRRLGEVDAPDAFPDPSIAAESADLDLFGRHSLYRLLGTAFTPEGAATLASWLAEPADVATVRERQRAAMALADAVPWREEFELLARRLFQVRQRAWRAEGSEQGSGSSLVRWCAMPGWLQRHRPVLWIARLTAAVVLAGVGLTLFGGAPVAWTAWPVLGAMAVNFVLAVFCSGAIHDEFNLVSAGEGELALCSRMFEAADRCPARGGALDGLRTRLFADGGGVLAAIRQLVLPGAAARLRKGGLWFLPWIVLQFVAFIDVHVLDWLERWKRRFGSQVAGWFRALGEWEALASMGRLAWENPGWCWPELVDPGSGERLEAAALGHPLIPPDRAVANDVQIGPAGKFLLVTGSNMSGKSTLLRSIGLNVILAQMGAPACAGRLRLPAVRISTSMRVSDSLSDGVSFFMAELRRLKAIVDAAQHRPEGRGHLFLLDEILQGTNSRERQIAVAAVIEALLGAGSMGAVSTHDLELAGVPSLARACETVHFREHFIEADGQRRMTFDYRARPGVSPTTNALKLLELVGLKLPAPGDQNPES